jgi:hypothetical protein
MAASATASYQDVEGFRHTREGMNRSQSTRKKPAACLAGGIYTNPYNPAILKVFFAEADPQNTP